MYIPWWGLVIALVVIVAIFAVSTEAHERISELALTTDKHQKRISQLEHEIAELKEDLEEEMERKETNR